MNEQLPINSALSRAENFKANFRLIRQRQIMPTDPSASPQEKSFVVLAQVTVNFYDAPTKGIQSILPSGYQITNIAQRNGDQWAIKISYNKTPCGTITVTANDEKVDISYSHSTLAVFFNQKPNEEFPIQNWLFAQEEQRLRLCLKASYDGTHPEARLNIKMLIEGNSKQSSMLDALCDWREKYQSNPKAIELLTNILSTLRMLMSDPADTKLNADIHELCNKFVETYDSTKSELSQAKPKLPQTSGEKFLKVLFGVSLVTGTLGVTGIALTHFIPMEELLMTAVFWTSGIILTLALATFVYASIKLSAGEPSKSYEADGVEFKGRNQTQAKDPAYEKLLSGSNQKGHNLSSFLSQQNSVAKTTHTTLKK